MASIFRIWTRHLTRALAEQEEAKGVYFVGRLANYKYFNMDQVIANTVLHNTSSYTYVMNLLLSDRTMMTIGDRQCAFLL